jgi:hypothetical protein
MSFQVGAFQPNFQQDGVAPAVVRTSGGISRSNKRKRYYLERDGNILLFDRKIDVEIYRYHEELNKPKAEKPKVKKVLKAKKVEPSKVINKQSLQKFVEVQEIPENVYELARMHDIELLLDIYKKYEMWMDEQDVEILLLH